MGDEAPPALSYERDDVIDTVTADQVAEAIALSSSIGAAQAALAQAGWRAKIAGNRISVNDQISVQYLGATSQSRAVWIVHGDAGPIVFGSTGDGPHLPRPA